MAPFFSSSIFPGTGGPFLLLPKNKLEGTDGTIKNIQFDQKIRILVRAPSLSICATFHKPFNPQKTLVPHVKNGMA